MERDVSLFRRQELNGLPGLHQAYMGCKTKTEACVLNDDMPRLRSYPAGGRPSPGHDDYDRRVIK